MPGYEPSRLDRRALVATGFALSALCYGLVFQLEPDFALKAPFGRDFLNFWMGGHLTLEGRAADLMRPETYERAARAVFHYGNDHFLFSYPPPILPLLIPFGAAPYVVALVAWTLLNFVGLAAAAKLLSRDGRTALAACLSPAAFVMALYGHFGGALAFLGTFALTRAGARPRLAGGALALIAVKPQIAAALAVLLLLGGRWRPDLWAVPPGLALAALATAVVGLEPWRGYFEWVAPYQTRLLTDLRLNELKTVVSPFVGLRRAGLGFSPALAGQAVFSAVVMAGGALRLRRAAAAGRLDAGDVAALLLAALLALPYANHYDLAMAAPALAVALLRPAPDGRPPLLRPLPGLVLWLTPLLAMPNGFRAFPLAIGRASCRERVYACV